MNSDFEAVNDIKTAVIKRQAVIKNDRYYIADEYVDGRKIMQGEYNSVSPWTEDGPFIFYDHEGNKYAEGNFVNGVMDGQWIYYDSEGADTVLYKKEWMEKVKAGRLRKNTGTLKNADEKFFQYIKNNIHYPPKYIMDCISRGEMFYIAISPEREIFPNPFYDNLENDFIFELYRALFESPDSIIFQGGKRKKLYYTASINYNCPGKSEQNILNSCNGPAFVFVEEQAVFQGGNLENFRNWVQKNLIYPAKSVENNETGRITFQFTVTSEGKVDCIKMLRSSGYNLLDLEAIRVIGLSPPWIPAKQDGKAVNQQFVMPVIFQIEDVIIH
jgi:TonB family protein